MKWFIDKIDLNLPDEQLAEWLNYALDQYSEAKNASCDDIQLESDELAVLKDFAYNAAGKTRGVAVKHLFRNGPCDWHDIETWVLESDADIRRQIISDIDDDSIGGELWLADKKRCMELLETAAQRYLSEYAPIEALRELAMKDDEWLDISWAAANRLLDVNDIDLNTQLIAVYFEHLISDLNWGPDDRHIQAWISGKDSWRQCILLKTATWMGLDTGKLRDIVKALTGSKCGDIAKLARGVLDGKVGYGDL